MEDNKKMLEESLMKMKSLMNFTPGMTATENKEVIKEEAADARVVDDIKEEPEVAEEVAECDDVKEEDVAEEVKEEEVAECDDVKEEDVAEEDVAEEDVTEVEAKEGYSNMAVGFVNESNPSNKEVKRKNKQDRLDKKLGRI